MYANSSPRTLGYTEVIGFIKSHSQLTATKISQVLALIFYGIISEIALKYCKFTYAKNSELYMNHRWDPTKKAMTKWDFNPGIYFFVIRESSFIAEN